LHETGCGIQAVWSAGNSYQDYSDGKRAYLEREKIERVFKIVERFEVIL